MKIINRNHKFLNTTSDVVHYDDINIILNLFVDGSWRF